MDIEKKLQHIFEALARELSGLRTARATPALVENLEVEYYGSKMALKTTASIASSGPRELVIKPWDKTLVPAIEQAIQRSGLGMNPVTDRDAIRLSIPPLTEERRRELAKILGKRLEEARIKVRQVREDALRHFDRREKAKEISEDEKFRGRNELQKTVDEINKKIGEVAAAKEKEILSV